jgi:hypothetical protein
MSPLVSKWFLRSEFSIVQYGYLGFSDFELKKIRRTFLLNTTTQTQKNLVSARRHNTKFFSFACVLRLCCRKESPEGCVFT